MRNMISFTEYIFRSEKDFKTDRHSIACYIEVFEILTSSLRFLRKVDIIKQNGILKK
jgi:hypothetical protein